MTLQRSLYTADVPQAEWTGTYTILSESSSEIELKRLTGNKKYTDPAVCLSWVPLKSYCLWFGLYRTLEKKLKVQHHCWGQLPRDMGQNLVPLVNLKIAGKWMFIPLKMVLIGIDP